MKKYIKPQIKTEEIEAKDIITVSSGLFSGLADLDNSSSIEFGEEIFDPKEAF